MQGANRKERDGDRIRLLNLLDHEKEEDEMSIQKEAAKKLHEAAINGSVPDLLELLRQGPQILSPTLASSPISDPPLHVATLLGHHDFARELLRRKPELAGQQNSDGTTPLHIAAAKGYVEIVKYLVLVNPDLCFVLDRGGRSPLHVAAVKGRVEVVKELIGVKPEAAWVLTAGGESCLHLCVKYNRWEALKVLVEFVKKDDLVNWKDGEGNTLLHLAVAKKQIQIIRYLLTKTAIQLSTRNAKDLTAMDVLSQSPRDLRDMEIKECLNGGAEVETRFLNNAAALNALSGEIAKVASTKEGKKLQNGEDPKKHKHIDWLGRKRSAVMVVASLLGTVAFQAAIAPPGGFWQSDFIRDSNGTLVNNPHEAGKSVLAYKTPKAYGHFMIFDTIAFLASFSIILIQISGLPLHQRKWMWTQMIIMWIAICAQTLTYFIAFIYMSSEKVQGVLYNVTKISMIGWMSVMALVVVGNLVRATRWLLVKYGYMKEKEKISSLGEDDEDDEFL